MSFRSMRVDDAVSFLGSERDRDYLSLQASIVLANVAEDEGVKVCVRLRDSRSMREISHSVSEHISSRL